MSRHERPYEGDDDAARWFMDRLGQPIPCSLCKTPTPPANLRERWMVGVVVEVIPGCEVAPQTAVYLCPTCPG